MTMYILDDSKIVAALVAAKQAGRDVRVVLNQTFPAGTTQSNPSTYSTLTSAAIGVVWRSGPAGAAPGAYTRERTFVVDGKTAWIMSMDLTRAASLYDREFVAVDTDPSDVTEADAIFLADYSGTSSSAGAPLVVSPDNARSDLVALINTATTSLDLEVEEFSDTSSNGVAAAVAAAAKRGVATRLIVANTTFTNSQTTAIATVKAAGVRVVMSGGASGTSTASNPYIHAKAITVDCSGTTCARGFVGSQNFSAASLANDRELGVIVDDPTALARLETSINADFAAGTPQ
jgi:phosphatidylserine/phosphatidylglycerophosphate/cardiolipin synthase-like enzyme